MARGVMSRFGSPKGWRRERGRCCMFVGVMSLMTAEYGTRNFLKTFALPPSRGGVYAVVTTGLRPRKNFRIEAGEISPAGRKFQKVAALGGLGAGRRIHFVFYCLHHQEPVFHESPAPLVGHHAWTH